MHIHPFISQVKHTAGATRRIYRSILPTLAFIFLWMPNNAFAQADKTSPCDRVISDAETMFFNASFEQAIEALTWCIADKSFSDPEKIQAQRITRSDLLCGSKPTALC